MGGLRCGRRWEWVGGGVVGGGNGCGRRWKWVW